jgi:adenosylcobinamide-phosphate synthase
VSVLGAAAGLAVDHVAGEPPVRWHPVARYGTMMQAVEARIYADRRRNGVVHLAIGAGAAIVVGQLLRRMLGRHAATAIAVAACAAGRMLDDEANAMSDLLRAGDLDSARERVRSLVGRQTSDLDTDEIARAVIESVAENLVDAVTATLWWATIGGAAGALAHRAINTLDAMVGHHDARYEHFGWASAKVDDVANYVPARLTAAAVAMAHPQRARDIWRIVRRDAHQHPSPNGGIVEAAFAAALGVTLGGTNRYGDTMEHRGTLGDGPRPTADDIAAAVRLRRLVATITAVSLVVGSLTASASRRYLRRNK